MQLLQDNIYVQKFSKIMPLYNVQKNAYGLSVFSNIFYMIVCCIVFMTSLSKVYNNNLQRSW